MKRATVASVKTETEEVAVDAVKPGVGSRFPYELACECPPVDHRRSFGQYRPDQFED